MGARRRAPDRGVHVLPHFRSAIGKETSVKVQVTDECIRCGLCVDMCPEVFRMGDEYAEVVMGSAAIPAEHEEAVREAAAECPVAAIVVS